MAHLWIWAALTGCFMFPIFPGDRVGKPTDVLKPGQQITAKVLKFDRAKGKDFSRHQADPDGPLA